jgi:hypothetical protein
MRPLKTIFFAVPGSLTSDKLPNLDYQCTGDPEATRTIAGESGERSKSWEDAPNAQRNTATAVGSVDHIESGVVRVRMRILKQGTRPAFSFAKRIRE